MYINGEIENYVSCLFSYDRTLSDVCISLADKWSDCDVANLSQFKPVDLEQFSAYQKKAFLGLLLQHVSFANVHVWLKLVYANNNWTEYNECVYITLLIIE